MGGEYLQIKAGPRLFVVLAALILPLAGCMPCRRDAAGAAFQAEKGDRVVDEKEPERKALNVIFVGNSYTFCNDLPGTIGRLLEAGGTELRAGRYLKGGATLRQHWAHNLGQADEGDLERAPEASFDDWKGRFDALLAGGKCDYVILQGNSRDTLMDWGFEEAARLWCEKLGAESPDTKVLFFMTWARKNLPQDQATITGGYRDVARRNGALVAPVGEAWRAALEARHGLVLHVEDNSHPAPLGTYLAACVFYASLTGKSPVGLPARFSVAGDRGTDYALSDEDAAFFQQVAWEAYLENEKVMEAD